jgi:hypothetical protein
MRAARLVAGLVPALALLASCGGSACDRAAAPAAAEAGADGATAADAAADAPPPDSGVDADAAPPPVLPACDASKLCTFA